MLLFIRKKIMQSIFGILIILSCISCQENKQEESLKKYLNLRKEKILTQRKKIGENEKEIIKKLKNAIRFDQLMEFVERKSYKSNLKSRKIADELFEFKEDIWSESPKAKVKIVLKYLVNNDTIRLGHIQYIKLNNQILSENLTYRIDNRFINELIVKHNKAFSSQKNTNDLVNYVIESGEVQIASGYGGAYYGEKETEMYCGFKDGNFDFIDVLLRSIIPEEQTVGVIGYNKLKSLQIENNKEHDKLVTKILAVNPEINVRYTCTDKIVPIKEYLSLLDWDEIPNIGLNCTDGKLN